MMFAQVLVTEFIKLRRSKVPWFTLLGLSLGPLGIALFMWIVREPGRAAQLGLLGAKANLTGLEATWPSFLSLLALIVGIGGMILLSFVVAYVFGREYTDGTAKTMFTEPVARHWFVLAKLVVCAAWWVVLVVAVFVESLVIGFALGLPGLTAGLVANAAVSSLAAAAISFLLSPIVAWMTTLGRGYMPPLAFTLAMLGLGNIFAKTGWGVWFPWSIVPLIVGTVGKATTVPAGSYVVLGLVFVLGVGATIAQVRRADLTQ
jgi:ABC-type transport system involved in multi-copper enzyme maturation permease subunit